MKKFLILFFSMAVLAACSNDDDGEAAPDPILGTWVLVGATLFSPEACAQESVITFNQDNTAIGTFFVGEAQCSAQSSEGTWQNLGGSSYSIEVPIGELQGTAVFTDPDNFIFTTSSIGSLTFERQ